MDGKTPAESAQQEAWEEAGVIGKASDRCLGIYSYSKLAGDDVGMPCVAMIYPVKVKSLKRDYPEARQRQRKWVTRKRAAKMMSQPELSRILLDFDPRIKK